MVRLDVGRRVVEDLHVIRGGRGRFGRNGLRVVGQLAERLERAFVALERGIPFAPSEKHADARRPDDEYCDNDDGEQRDDLLGGAAVASATNMSRPVGEV